MNFLKTCFLGLCLSLIVALQLPSIAIAQQPLGGASDSRPQKQLSANDVHLMILHFGTGQMPFAGGVFCPVKNGTTKKCRGDNGGYVMGPFGFNIDAEWISRKRKSGAPGAMLDSVPVHSGGQFVLFEGQRGGNSKVLPNGGTYAFVAKRGVVYVIPARTQTMEQAVDSARAILASRYGKQSDSLRVEPIAAVEYNCSSKRRNRVCTVGKQLDPRSLVARRN